MSAAMDVIAREPRTEPLMIELDGIEKVYRTERIETIALQGVSLEVEKGEFVSIMGPSGCGKSTLLNVIGLLDAPSGGRLTVAGEEIGRYSDRKLAAFRNAKLGFIFQSFHLVPDLEVVDNVEIPLLYRKVGAKARRAMAMEALDRVGLSSRTRHFPGQLSGGQQQRVAIARAIVGKPEILLADEPTGNLDSQMGDEIMHILETLRDEEKTTIVMVTHDARLAEKTDHIVRLFDGRRVN